MPFYRRPILVLLLVACAVIGTSTIALAQTFTNLFFLHHSTGRNIINDGDMRAYIDDYNNTNGTAYDFWDHDYNYIGLKNPAGANTGIDYDIPGDNTDPIGLYNLWTTENSARDDIVANHEVIAFKSCYPACHIENLLELRDYILWYLRMRDYFDTQPDRLFIVMSPPPLHRNSTNLTEADNARAFADWLISDFFLAGHPNIFCFNLFDHLAHPDDGSDTRNMLRYEYERSHYGTDGHPNALANSIVGPLFCDFFIQVTNELTDVSEASPAVPILRQNYPNPFNPLTRIDFDLAEPARVSLRIYDLGGRLIRTLVEAEQSSGPHSVLWNGQDGTGKPAASGMYVYRLKIGEQVQMRKMVLSK